MTSATPTNANSSSSSNGVGGGGGAGIVMMVQAAVIIGPKDSNINYGTEAPNHIRSHTKIRADNLQKNYFSPFLCLFSVSGLVIIGNILTCLLALL